jgi:hypothetical protein
MLEFRFSDGDYDWCLQGCDVMMEKDSPKFQRNVLPPSSESKKKPTWFLLVTCLACPLTLTIEAVGFSEMSVNLYRTTWRHIPEKI